MVIEKYTQEAKEQHEGKYYIVIEEWERGHEELIDPELNPLGKLFIGIISAIEVFPDNITKLRTEIEELKLRITELEPKEVTKI